MTAPATEETTSRRGLIVGLLAGIPVMAYGVRGVFVDSRLTEPAELARWALGAAVINDLLVIPLAAVVGIGSRRVVPAFAWPAVRWAAFTSAVLGLISWPFVRGYGQDPLTPSLLPRDYTAGVLAAVAVVWALAGIWIAISYRRRSPGGHLETTVTRRRP